VYKAVVREQFGFTEGNEDWDKVGHHNNIDQFKKDWIETAGMNEISVDWDPKNFESNKGTVTVKQTYCMEKYQT